MTGSMRIPFHRFGYRYLCDQIVTKSCELTRNQFLQELQGIQGGQIYLEKLASKKLAVITIRNERVRNALSGTMMVQLRKAVNELSEWKEGKGLLVIGEGGNFCSGADLSIAKQLNKPAHGEAMCELMQQTLTQLKRLPLISLAVIEGKALGGGAEVERGVSPGWGGGARLVKIVGRRTALKLLACCSRIRLEDALAYGLADGSLTNHESARNEGLEWLGNITAGPTDSLRAIKQVVAYGDDLAMDQALEKERSVFTTLWGAPTLMKSLQTKKKY